MESKNKHPDSLDESLYSRQLYVIGHEPMKRLMNTRVLIIGTDGLGQEIAKNICLAGIKSIHLYDKNKVTANSLCAGFFFKKSDLNKDRDKSCAERIRKLNRYVSVEVEDSLDLRKYDIVVSVNQTLADNIKLNQQCHANGIKFILGNVSGLFSQIFVDFNEHKIHDKNGQELSNCLINDISENGIVTLAHGSKHSLEDNDFIKIKDKLFKIKVISRSQIQIMDYEKIEGKEFEQVKVPFNQNFDTLETALLNPKIEIFSDFNRVNFLHNLFTNPTKCDEAKEFRLLKSQYDKTKGCLIPPMVSVVGGILAQEALKGGSGTFMPINQFFYFDSAEAYVENEVSYSDTRYFDMAKIFSEEGFDKLKRSKIFLVGAGAIGCENIKNFVCSGISSEGKITVTDLDSVEHSNLNRQFLFGLQDVGKMKSECAARNALSLNEDFQASGQIVALTSAVGGQTEELFSDEFFCSHDVVSNALDNVEARNYMDQRCIKLRRPMFDAGTMGTKGHLQVVLPFVSECYSSSVDPIENSIPLCTIKSYPYAIEHCIEWALSEFKQLFNQNVQTLKDYLSDPQKYKEDDETLEIFANYPKSVEDCLKLSLSLFVNHYSTSINKLLEVFPEEHAVDGVPFWSPPKRIPHAVSFNVNDRIHILFVKSCANLYASSHGIREIPEKDVFAFLENILSLKEPNPIHFDGCADLTKLTLLEFEKDSWHSDFIFACANIRARNYGIKERSKHFITGVAGNIIPAIATTTAIVSGLASLEIIKYITKIKDNKDYLSGFDISDGNICNGGVSLRNSNLAELSKNYYLDLAIPFLASTDLVKPKVSMCELNGSNIYFDLWSRMEHKDTTLREMIEFVSDMKVNLEMVCIGGKVVHWNFSNKFEGNLDKKISELCEKKKGQKLVYVDILSETELIPFAVLF